MEKIFGFTALSCFLLVFAGCQHHSTETDSESLIVGLSVAPTNLDPRRATDANSQRTDDLIFSSLVRNGPRLTPVPQGATSWKIEDKKITFFLRKDLKFSNGRGVTADDVIFSFTEYKKPGSPFASTLQAIQTISAPDPYRIVLNLSENDGSLLTNLNNVKILPKEAVEKWGDRFSEHPEGAGPYAFVSQDNNQLVLKKSPFQSYADPKVDNVIFKFVRDENTRYLKMIKGDLDFLLNEMDEEKITEIKKSPKINVLVTPGLNFNYLLLNLRDDRLKEIKLRQALYFVINTDEIIKYKLDGLATRAMSIIAPPSPYADGDLKFPKLSLTEARKVIKDLGLENTSISLEVSDQAVTNGQILSQQMESLGIKVPLKSFEWGTFYSDLKAGRFQMATARWVGIVDPDIYRESLDSHEFVPGQNRGFYSNPAFDNLVENARREMTPELRKKLYFTAEQMIADDLPIIPLWYNANVSVLSKRIKNFTPMITGSFFPLTEVTKE